jgi:uncharacterized protein with beta-barrel porin domain
MGRADSLHSRPWKGIRVLPIMCANKHGATTRRGTRRLLAAALCTGLLFVADPAVALTRDEAVIEAGLDYAIAPNASFGLSYGGQFGSGTADHSAKANFNVRF